MNDIKDSGERRIFDTGAQRDRAFGKGLPALISPVFVKDYIASLGENHTAEIEALKQAYEILETGDWTKSISVIHSLEPRIELMLWRLSFQLEKGAAKYSARNWEKGMPMEEYCNSLIRHILALIEGKTDEPHLDAALFNAMALYHTGVMIKRGILPEELNNLPRYVE